MDRATALMMYDAGPIAQLWIIYIYIILAVTDCILDLVPPKYHAVIMTIKEVNKPIVHSIRNLELCKIRLFKFSSLAYYPDLQL